MNQNNRFDPKIERNLYDRDELQEDMDTKSLNEDKQMKSFFKRNDFPFFLLGGFVLILLIFILFKLPETAEKKGLDESLKGDGAKELKQALDDIRKEIVEIRYNISSGLSSKEDISMLLNELEQRFDQKFVLIENKVDDLKSVIEKNNLKKQTNTISGKITDKKPLFEKKSVSIKDSETVKKFYHTVKKGDTLYSISRKYGVEVAEIKKLNNMKNNSIQPGGKLLIKK